MTWMPIDSAPQGVWLIGRKPEGWHGAPLFIGQVYKMRPGALLNPETGKWCACTHWWSFDGEPMPPPPEQEQ